MIESVAGEIWGELKRYVNTVDRAEAAETVLSILIDNDCTVDDIKDAFKGDSDIKRALQEIPEDFRIIVYLADVEGFSYKEIAEIVGAPAGTVMSRLHRGRKQLREKLSDYARELGYSTDAPAPKAKKKGGTE